MLLEIQERLALLELLPREGDFAAIKTLRRAREMISFTPEENEALKFEQKGEGLLLWNIEAGVEMLRDIPIDEWTTNQIRQILIGLSNDNKLTDMHYSLYEKFVVAYE